MKHGYIFPYLTLDKRFIEVIFLGKVAKIDGSVRFITEILGGQGCMMILNEEDLKRSGVSEDENR